MKGQPRSVCCLLKRGAIYNAASTGTLLMYTLSLCSCQGASPMSAMQGQTPGQVVLLRLGRPSPSNQALQKPAHISSGARDVHA